MPVLVFFKALFRVSYARSGFSWKTVQCVIKTRIIERYVLYASSSSGKGYGGGKKRKRERLFHVKAIKNCPVLNSKKGCHISQDLNTPDVRTPVSPVQYSYCPENSACVRMSWKCLFIDFNWNNLKKKIFFSYIDEITGNLKNHAE